MARLEPELNPGATCWYLMGTETTTVSPGRSSPVTRHSEQRMLLPAAYLRAQRRSAAGTET